MKKSEQLISFTEDLAVLLKAGSDLDSALAVIANVRSSGPLGPVISQLRSTVRQGLPLSSALQDQATLFDSYFIGMVRSGEASGKLTNALEQIATQLERSQDLKNQINNSLIYPAILSIAMGLSIILVMGVILPKLTGLFESFGGELSPMAQLLLTIGQFMDSWGLAILMTLAATFILLYLLYDMLHINQRALSLARRLPFIKTLFSQIEFARFTSTLSSLLAAGVSQTDALSIAAESFQHDENRRQIESAILTVKEGKSLSSAIQGVQGFGDLYAHSIESGERAGQLSETLSVLAGRLEKEFSRRAQRLASMVEPTLILTLGLVIGLIVVTVFSTLQSMGDLPL